MNWEKVDIWPKGKAGFDARYQVEGDLLKVFVDGTDHPLDWLHHFMPFSRKRERQAAEMIYKRISHLTSGGAARVGGFSLGGAVASPLADILSYKMKTELFPFGAKRSPLGDPWATRAYRHRGDFVPFLTPWRRRWPNQEVFGKRGWVWRVHTRAHYRSQMEQEGF